MTNNESQRPDNNAKETVLSFLQALNQEDFPAAGQWLNDELHFVGVMGTRNGAADYLRDMEKMKIKYDIKKAFADGEDVCVLCDFRIDGVTAFGCAWYQLEQGRISTIRVVFDPRPVLEHAQKK